MKNARLLVSFIAVFGVFVTSCRGQWRPQYSPYAATVYVINSTLLVTLKYNQWQGNFASIFTLPAGHPLCLLCIYAALSPIQAYGCINGMNICPRKMGTRAAVKVGTGALDTGRNITWHIDSNLTFNIAPASAMDVDRVGEECRLGATNL